MSQADNVGADLFRKTGRKRIIDCDNNDIFIFFPAFFSSIRRKWLRYCVYLFFPYFVSFLAGRCQSSFFCMNNLNRFFGSHNTASLPPLPLVFFWFFCASPFIPPSLFAFLLQAIFLIIASSSPLSRSFQSNIFYNIAVFFFQFKKKILSISFFYL